MAAIPYRPKTDPPSSRKKILVISCVGVAIAILISVIYTAFPTSYSTEGYSIMVDPTKEKQSLFVLARVTVQNTGSQPLTNIVVDYGDGDKDFLGKLNPGQTIILSPPGDNSLQYVIVTADGGIHIFKAYREPVAMPGMMGS